MQFGQYNTFGSKAFAIMLSGRSLKVFGVLALAALLFFLREKGDASFAPVLIGGAFFGFGLFFILLVGSLLITWLEYKNYQFLLDENALKVKRGVIHKEEIAIPYRQIQDVNIKYDIVELIFGIRRIVMLASSQGKIEPPDRFKSIFPPMDSELAEVIREELIKQANVQKIQDSG